ncbi:MAG: DUF362 domain-containing protein [Eubacteriales bacterium]|nr:DUF362 domain-containing protein [Eubacteriales bacterium]
MSQIALIHLAEYDLRLIEIGLREAFTRLDLGLVFQAHEKILIKPNMLSAVGPERAVTPHPTVFEGLINQLSPYKLTLSYGDSPAVHSPKSAAKATGLAAVADRLQIPLADFDRAVEYALPDGVRLRQIHLAAGVAESDGLINLCKLKTHALTSMTGAIKNLYGVIAGTRKAQMHVQFPDTYAFTKMLAELNQAIRPRVHIMDAIVAMEGNGPMNGRPRHAGWILVSTDPVAIDTAGSMIMGYDPRSLAVITASEAAGLGCGVPAEIEAFVIEPAHIMADLIPSPTSPVMLSSLQHSLLVPNFARPKVASSIMTLLTRVSGPILRRWFLSRPAIAASACTRCGQCVAACPVEPKALLQPSNRAVPTYQYERCIRCYCCQETCPTGAIHVVPSSLGRLTGRKGFS